MTNNIETEAIREPETLLAELEHWTYEVESPFRPAHELLGLVGEAASSGEDLVEQEAWTGTSDQVLFREGVLRAHLERGKKRKGLPGRDLRPDELGPVAGTQVQMRRPAAAAAGRLLAAANAALAAAQVAGDEDARRTAKLTASSGYRGRAHQEALWRRYFERYFNETQQARAGLPGGPYGPAAVTHLLETYGIPKRIAAPGYSNHQNGIAIDFLQQRTRGHRIRNSTSAPAGRAWRATWFHRWLQANAESFGFRPYQREPWHWEFSSAPRAAREAWEMPAAEDVVGEDWAAEDMVAQEADAAVEEEELLGPEEAEEADIGEAGEFAWPGETDGEAESGQDEDLTGDEAFEEDFGAPEAYAEAQIDLAPASWYEEESDPTDEDEFADAPAEEDGLAEYEDGAAEYRDERPEEAESESPDLPTEQQAAPPQATQLIARNTLFGWTDPVVHCEIEVIGQGLVGRTSVRGSATLNLSAVPDGAHRLRFLPAQSWTAAVGPATAATTPRPNRIWRPLEGEVTIRSGRVTAVSGPGLQLAGHRLTARLQPVWIASPNRAPRPATTPPSMIVVHHTAGPRIGPTLNQFVQPRRTSAHYVIDIDGQIVKMVHDSEQATHAGRSHWASQDHINRRSVGIEVVHRRGAFPAAQMTSLTRLLRDLIAAYPSIPATAIVGHSDIATNPGPYTAAKPRRLGRKSGDPGLDFDWAALRAAGLGIRIRTGPPAPSALGMFFNAFPAERLALRDRDAGQVYGGSARPTAPGGVIGLLQRLLARIGYWCPQTSRYDRPTHAAVEMFQQHFMGASQPRPARVGEVDAATANLIQLVA